ncbi:MAG TPA: PH domain-containing protein [Baekduia sp.]|nr:PH domain-containing protein [Baekduia sp.]
MDLHPGETVVFEGHPSWRGVLSFYLKGLAVALVIAVIVFFAVSTAAGIVVLVVLGALVLLAGFVKRMSTHYVITTDRLRIRRGILSKAVQQTSIDRVQNVNTDQSLVDRILRVGKVDFDTAGTDDSDFTFRGVADPDGVVAAVDEARRGHANPAL